MSDEATKRAKRGHGEGSYRQMPNGTWQGRVTLPDGRQRSVYAKTERQARDKAKEAIKQAEAGVKLPTRDDPKGRQTVAEFLARWLRDDIKPHKAPRTHEFYERIVRVHIAPAIGEHRLDKLTPQHVAAMLAAKGETAAPRMVHHIRTVLRTALNQAVRYELVPRNVAALTTPPRVPRAEPVFLDHDGARARLNAARGNRFEAAFQLGLKVGLREGEILGLKWDDLDLDARRLTVRRTVQRAAGRLIEKEPKTEKSRRTVKLPPSVAATLRARRDQQAFERQAAGEFWNEAGFVFATKTGGPIDPRNFIRAWHDLHTGAGLDRVKFHATRHTAASLLHAEGLSLKVIQEVLGHSMLSTTADIYGHVFQEAFDEAADAMERALGG